MSSVSLFISLIFLLNGCNGNREISPALSEKNSSEAQLGGCAEQQKIILQKYENNFDSTLISVLDFLLKNNTVKEELPPCSK